MSVRGRFSPHLLQWTFMARRNAGGLGQNWHARSDSSDSCCSTIIVLQLVVIRHIMLAVWLAAKALSLRRDRVQWNHNNFLHVVSQASTLCVLYLGWRTGQNVAALSFKPQHYFRHDASDYGWPTILQRSAETRRMVKAFFILSSVAGIPHDAII